MSNKDSVSLIHGYTKVAPTEVRATSLSIFLALTAWLVTLEVYPLRDCRLEQEGHSGLFRCSVCLLTVALYAGRDGVLPSIAAATTFWDDVVVSEDNSILGCGLSTVPTGVIVST